MSDRTTKGSGSASQKDKLKAVIDALYLWGNGEIQRADVAAALGDFRDEPEQPEESEEVSER